jgi:hypothetical protein
MAFEVARVHQLICSRVGDGVEFQPFKNQSASVEAADPTWSWALSPQGAQHHAHFPADLSYSFRGCDTSGMPLEASPCSTETESDEDDDLLQTLAQQIAHSMLDDDTNVETGVGVRRGNGYFEPGNLSHVEVNEVSVSVSSRFPLVTLLSTHFTCCSQVFCNEEFFVAGPAFSYQLV